MQFTDRLTLDGAIRRTGDGYGVISARVARAGNVQLYLGSELGMNDKAVVRVYRPENEVFKKDAIASYAGVPVTIDHPKNGVNAATWKDLAVGEVGDDVLRDGEFVRVPMMLRDAKAVKAVEDGKRELSMGYSAEIKFADGTTPSGEAFDAIMSDFKMNHVAIVDKARGGEELRIGDSAKWGASPFEDKSGLAPITMEKDNMSDTLKTVVLGDKAVQVAIADVAAFEAFKADAAKALNDAKSESSALIAAKDKEIATRDATIDDLKTKVVDGAALDKLVSERSAIVDKAKKVAPTLDCAGKSNVDIRRLAVAAKLGDAAVKDKSDDYIEARFDTLVDGVSADPFARVVADGVKPNLDATGSENKAWNDSVSDLNAWRYKKEA
ncbi:DUF2213 domain-containing protein [Agrobacterium rosae]|uniref:DUF2213 domain-containing protein n=1 Tax=Agrobacterium rosae TaxID=1972867 RepID=UPI0019D38409|nr:DUF2213 domain-containing protein [Agrobacterium rosae]MBN7804899.1 DUF2213 domain-containing protein [Agrobacterium rosae]